MKVTAITYGDRSVGIQPTEVEINYVGVDGVDLDQEDRLYLRQKAREIANNLSGEEDIRFCFFEDECPECGARVMKPIDSETPRCFNLNCICNIPDSED